MTDDFAELRRARSRGRRLAAENAVIRGRLDEATARALQRERQIEHLATRLAKAARRVEELRREVADQSYWRAYATWQLDSLRAARWYRLGEALTTAKKGRVRGLPAFPGGLRRAMRAQARPEVPRRTALTAEPPIGPADTALIDVPAVVLPDGPIRRPEYTVAAIMDTFTATALRYEWRQLDDFGPADWRDVVEADRPDLLFVESAWAGNGGRWAHHVNGSTAPSPELRDLVGWCREHAVPSVFWNKEDPPNFEFFIETAKLFDWVFTVDAGSLSRYREILGHDRVRVLQFGAQPRVHNPVRVADQGRYDVAFAGTYYTAKHPGRREQMETVVTPALKFGVHIYSRVDPTDSRFAFPAAYLPHIVGTLPYEKMLAAQKLYKVMLNVNSVVDSPTMCARRAFELSAAQIPVVSGAGRAVTETFGDLIPTVGSPAETTTVLRRLLNSPELRDRQAHLAMRKVFAEHTYGHRVDAVLGELGLPAPELTPPVSVIAVISRAGQPTHVIEQAARQTWRPLQLVLVMHGLDLDPGVVAEKARATGIEDVVVLSAGAATAPSACLNLGAEAADGAYVGVMDEESQYGPYYLSDLMTAFTYTDAGVVGKLAHYLYLAAADATALYLPEQEHRQVDTLRAGTLLTPGDLLRDYPFEGDDPEQRLFRTLTADGVGIYAADRYSFVATHDGPQPPQDAQVVFYGPPDRHALF